jgi:hypothetical protein
MLTVLVRNGLATTEPRTVRASGRQIEVMWMMITDAGRRRLPRRKSAGWLRSLESGILSNQAAGMTFPRGCQYLGRRTAASQRASEACERTVPISFGHVFSFGPRFGGAAGVGNWLETAKPGIRQCRKVEITVWPVSPRRAVTSAARNTASTRGTRAERPLPSWKWSLGRCPRL